MEKRIRHLLDKHNGNEVNVEEFMNDIIKLSSTRIITILTDYDSVDCLIMTHAGRVNKILLQNNEVIFYNSESMNFYNHKTGANQKQITRDVITTEYTIEKCTTPGYSHKITVNGVKYLLLISDLELKKLTTPE